MPARQIPARQIIVDGSNLATEGRSLPSLTQLDQAVREYLAENPSDVVTVVVDASFGHRIPSSEVPMFEEAEAAGELVSPPAGAIGRGDAFLLRIAEKTGATVLSNDSFQEFHGEHPWLFEDGRLVGGKPVPGVGWIFLPRTPVRGQRSREVVKEAKRRKAPANEGAGTTSHESGLDLAAAKAKGRGKKVDRAIARATEEAVEPKAKGRRRRRAGSAPPAEAVNEPLAFITFIAAHPLGSEVAGTVLEFSSHGAFVKADGARCYLPLSAMGNPPPRRAREVVAKGEERTFVVQALDPQRRGIELALPGYAKIAGGPTEETVEAEIHPRAETTPKRRRREKAGAAALDGSTPVEAETPLPALVGSSPVPGPADRPPGGDDLASVAAAEPASRAGGRKAAPAAERKAEAAGVAATAGAASAKAAPAQKGAAQKAPAQKSAAQKAVAQKAPAQKAPAQKAPAQKAPAQKAPAEKAPAQKRVAQKAPAQKRLAQKAPAQKEPARMSPAQAGVVQEAPPGKATAAKKAPAKKATPAKKAPAKKAPAKKATPAKKAAAQKTPAKKATPARKATPAKATTTKASPAQNAAPVENAAPPEGTAARKSGPRRSAPAGRKVTKAATDSPDRVAEYEG